MTTLVPMRAEEFALFFEMAVASYAADNVAVGRWSKSDAIDLSRAENERLLPQGLATPNAFLYEVLTEVGGTTVGYLWFSAVARGSAKGAFVYQVQIKPEFRRRGHARAALEAIEGIAMAEGLSSVALNVFAHNAGARALYGSLGYGVTSVNMLKPLFKNGA